MGGLIREPWKGVEFGRDLVGFVIPEFTPRGSWCYIFSCILFIHLPVLTLGFLFWATFSRLPYKT